MKIAKIQIGDYLQFKNLNLDLTYPEGHEKAGKPLDKVCFIGQSGTGKTSLLNLVRAIASIGLPNANYLSPNMKNITAEIPEGRNTTFLEIANGDFNSFKTSQGKKMNIKKYSEKKKNEYNSLYAFIAFPSEMNINIEEIFGQKNSVGIAIIQGDLEKQPSDKLSNSYFLDFAKSNLESTWNEILSDVSNHKTEQLSFNNNLTNQLNHNMIKAEDFLEKLVNWKKENPNPLKKLAEQLNPMLARFNLEIKPEFEFKTLDDLRFIQIYQKDSNTMIPNSGWSTGTKQLIMTATPLLKLNTEKSVILIDEPERSFYPDVQRDLMSFYRHLAPEAQFFVATHSPIIAASFEPWEIVELKFGENGSIVQEQYYDGERHINNYRFHPKYLRWDAILTRIFDLETDGMPDRNKKLQELARLDVQLRKLKKESGNANDEKAQKLWVEFKEIANLLDWKLEN